METVTLFHVKEFNNGDNEYEGYFLSEEEARHEFNTRYGSLIEFSVIVLQFPSNFQDIVDLLNDPETSRLMIEKKLVGAK